MVYNFTPAQVKQIVETLMQFKAEKVYDCIKMIDSQINIQNEANKNLVEKPNE